jgi:hypothetical protein
MTSISATPGSSYSSPLQKLQDELQSEVSSGAISSSDQTALSAALTDIDSSLKAGQTDPRAGSANSAPRDIKSKIDTLIANEVSSGKLTADQGTELQGVFNAAFANGRNSGPDITGGAGGAHHGHHGGHGGPQPTDGPNSPTTATGDATGSGSASDVLQQFLQSLKDAQSSSPQTTYGATGTMSDSSTTSTPSPLLVNYQT